MLLARRRFRVSDPLEACPGSESSSIEARVPEFADGRESSRPADPYSPSDNRWPNLPNGSKTECEGDSAVGLSVEAAIRRANEGVEESLNEFEVQVVTVIAEFERMWRG